MKSGFTLIELLLVIAIIFILTTVAIMNYSTAKKSFLLERSANKLAQEIRKTEQMAMSAEEIGPTGEEFYPEGGYGIYFKKPSTIIVFADCNNNKHYEAGAEYIRNITLETDVEISDISPTSPLNITFKAPVPVVSIPSNADEAEIVLSLTGTGAKTVKINKAGLIEVE